MKKVALLSIVAAALLFVGCEKKEQHTQQVEQKAQVSEAVKSSAQKVVKKVEEPLPGAAMSSKSEVQEATEAAVKEVKEAVSKATQEAKKAVNEAKEAVDKAAQSTMKEAKEAIKSALPGAAATGGANGAKGKELYAKCASCHGKDGKRKALGKSGIIAGQPKEELIKKIKGYKAGTFNLSGMGALMKSQVANLSDSDIEALAEYISSLK